MKFDRLSIGLLTLGCAALCLWTSPFASATQDQLNLSGQDGRESWTAALPPDAAIIVEIMGQSNSWGTKSFIQDVPEGTFDELPSDVFIWDKVGTLSALSFVDDGAWAPLEVGFGRSGPDSFGPEMMLALELRKVVDRPLFIIKCSRGETMIDSQPAVVDWSNHSEGEMFELWRDYYHRPALKQLKEAFGQENLFYMGVNWFQGVADSTGIFLGMHHEYEDNLASLLAAFRAEVGDQVPLTVGRSENYSPSQFTYINEIRAAQVLVAESTSRCLWYPTDNVVLPGGEELFEFASDNHHFNGMGQLDLGRSMAERLLEINLFVPVK